MDNREADRAGHPPYCTCVECTKARLKRQQEEKKHWYNPNLRIPYAQKKSHSNIANRRKSSMFRLPVKIVIATASIVSAILGVQGLWVYFTIPEWVKGWALFGITGINLEDIKLFDLIPVPTRFHSLVMWITENGLTSWFMPAVLIVVSILLWGVKSHIHTRRIPLPHWLW